MRHAIAAASLTAALLVAVLLGTFVTGYRFGHARRPVADNVPVAENVPAAQNVRVANPPPAEQPRRFGKGMGAFTIQAPNIAAGVARFILPGNKVDVLLTTAGIDPKDGGNTTKLLENVEVLAVDQQVGAPAGNKVAANKMRSVTLLVTPKQARELDLGQNKGTLRLLLRNEMPPSDARPEPKPAHRLQSPPSPVVPPPIRTLRGSAGRWRVIDPDAP